MDIRNFNYLLLISAVLFYFVPVENKVKFDVDKDLALVVFDDPLMYTLTQDQTTRMIDAKKFIRFKNRDEMYLANITLNNIDRENLKALTIIKKDNELILRDDVLYSKSNIVSLNTDELFYNLDTKVAYNTTTYNGTYFSHSIKGTKLYLNTKDSLVKSNNVHFEIDVKNKK